ncbi:hypothetical protein BWQ96_01226 [Gracilariopsis chorda]|uniref:SAM domain-containing protein n=1 Tax=Gracilariopsis chorda TaxID=448386 RepID=A0A2V3J3U9_9FLOR|nr:hypothetical protein BWQ96_01226 [Gracilariopsis chorda]|eukprot:PXF49088.1 hypothetical protein BWQ96_01226 [Gracilariopsis chorda]
MNHKTFLDACPSCSVPFTLFAPHDIESHINRCFDSKEKTNDAPICGTCHRDLRAFTPAARQEHANRCADEQLPLRPVKRKPPNSSAQFARPTVSSPPRQKCDEQLTDLLNLLGLQRYTQRFADEEIDLKALRLLTDEDFVRLRIPDPARRRIADALHAVPILDGLQPTDEVEPTNEERIIPTQRFATSRLGAMLQRRKPLYEEEDDDEYKPTQKPTGSQRHTPTGDSAPDRTSLMGTTKTYGISQAKLDTAASLRKEKYSSLNLGALSASSDESELDFERDISLKSQISLEMKIENWRRRQLRQEETRHTAVVQRIQNRYQEMVSQLEKEKENQTRPAEVLQKAEFNEQRTTAVVDLTEETVRESVEETRAAPDICINETVVISSAESDDNAKTARAAKRSNTYSDSDEESLRGMILKSHIGSALESDSDLDVFKAPKLSAGWRPGTSRELSLRRQKERAASDEEDMIDLMRERSPQDKSGTNNSALLREPSAGKRISRLSPKRACSDSDSNSEEGQDAVSRLKKKRTGTGHEIIATAIRKDRDLYDRILKVESVPYSGILNSVRQSGLNVSKKALTTFLHTEGIMYKGEAVSKGSRDYLNKLNSDF